jgi:hypothetical protein
MLATPLFLMWPAAKEHADAIGFDVRGFAVEGLFAYATLDNDAATTFDCGNGRRAGDGDCGNGRRGCDVGCLSLESCGVCDFDGGPVDGRVCPGTEEDAVLRLGDIGCASLNVDLAYGAFHGDKSRIGVTMCRWGDEGL